MSITGPWLAIVIIVGLLLLAGVLTRAITAVENARVAKHTGVDPRSDKELAKKVARGERGDVRH